MDLPAAPSPLPLSSLVTTPPKSPSSKHDTALGALSTQARSFLESDNYGISEHGELVTLRAISSVLPCPLVLEAVVGNGRTTETWVATGLGKPVVIKFVSHRHMASIARESIFYQSVFPALEQLRDLVPSYYGTFVGGEGGWYAIILEDCGKPVGSWDDWPDDNPKLMKQIRSVNLLDHFTLQSSGSIVSCPSLQCRGKEAPPSWNRS